LITKEAEQRKEEERSKEEERKEESHSVLFKKCRA